VTKKYEVTSEPFLTFLGSPIPASEAAAMFGRRVIEIGDVLDYVADEEEDNVILLDFDGFTHRALARACVTEVTA